MSSARSAATCRTSMGCGQLPRGLSAPRGRPRASKWHAARRSRSPNASVSPSHIYPAHTAAGDPIRRSSRRRWTEHSGSPSRATGSSGRTDRLDVPVGAKGVQAIDRDAADLLRDARVELNLAVAGIEPEHRLDEHERRSGGPRLRAAGGWIRHGKAAHRPVEPGKRLGQPKTAERRGLELAENDPVCLVAKAVTGEPERDQRVVVGPDGAGVIADGIEAAVVARKRSDSPA